MSVVLRIAGNLYRLVHFREISLPRRLKSCVRPHFGEISLPCRLKSCARPQNGEISLPCRLIFFRHFGKGAVLEVVMFSVEVTCSQQIVMIVDF